MTVPYIFATQTSSIPLSELDSNFATAITLGGTNIYLGNTTTTITGLTLTGSTFTGNVTSSNVTVTGGTIDATVIGGTTPAAGAFSLLNASGTVSGAGFSTYLASPPAIGGTAPNSGAFTSVTASETITGSLSAGAFSYGTLGYSDVNMFGSFTSSVNTYNQIILQNTNSGTAASTDYVVSNNLGTSTTYYGDFGMNSSGFSGSGSLNKANVVYLTSTSGDLAIGTTTSNAIHFVVNGGTTDAMTINSSGQTLLPGGTANGVAYLNGSNVLTTGSALTFDGTNLGLGVTPSAWVSPVLPAFDIGTYGGIASQTNAANLHITSNAFLGSGPAWKYKTSNQYAGRFTVGNDAGTGGFSWYIAPSGTAGNAISWTQALTLDNSGRLLVGLTSAVSTNADLQVNAPINFKGYTVAGLPTGTTGDRAYVTNALTPVFGSTVVGGGSVVVPVFYNGSNWIVG
jgi:hypothetical protein